MATYRIDDLNARAHLTDGSKGPTQKAAGQGTIAGSPLDDDARWHLAAELVATMRDAGYDCELLVEQTLQ